MLTTTFLFVLADFGPGFVEVFVSLWRRFLKEKLQKQQKTQTSKKRFVSSMFYVFYVSKTYLLLFDPREQKNVGPGSGLGGSFIWPFLMRGVTGL